MTDLQKDKRYIDMQAKYKGDKEKLAQAQMELYKEMKINPFASCLPTVIQLPVIIGLVPGFDHGIGQHQLSIY